MAVYLSKMAATMIGTNKKHGLPVHRFYHALTPKRRNGDETALGYGDCQFLANANCGENILQSGAKGKGRSGFRKQDNFFFFFFCLKCNDIRRVPGWRQVRGRCFAFFKTLIR